MDPVHEGMSGAAVEDIQERLEQLRSIRTKHLALLQPRR